MTPATGERKLAILSEAKDPMKHVLRSEPPNPVKKVGPWMQSTIEPDLNRKPLEISQE